MGCVIAKLIYSTKYTRTADFIGSYIISKVVSFLLQVKIRTLVTKADLCPRTGPPRNWCQSEEPLDYFAKRTLAELTCQMLETLLLGEEPEATRLCQVLAEFRSTECPGELSNSNAFFDKTLTNVS